MSRFRSLCAAVAAALLAPVAAPAAQTHRVTLQPGAPVDIGVEVFHDSLPPRGFVAVRVMLRNGTDSELRYRLAYAPMHRYFPPNVTREFTLTVAPEARAATLLYIPVLPAANQGSLQLRLTGPGVKSGEFALHALNGYRSGNAQFAGLGEGFALQNLGAVEAEAKKLSGGSGGALPLTRISSAFAPGDRRAYDGFSSLWFSEADWAALEPVSRAAIREWVLLGGRLHLVAGAGVESAETLGFGEIRRMRAGADDPHFAARVARMMRDATSPVTQLTSGQAALFSAFNAASVSRPVALILLLIAFGLVVGPVNLFVFAAPPHRHRLLWTTPLIALVAALMLLGAILAIDGTGGSGRRYALAVLDPESKRIALWQQQISRTGLLLGDAFAFAPSAMLAPVENVPPSPAAGDFVKTASGWSGDWFTGRAIAAQAVLDTAAARGGVRVRTDPGGRPVAVISSLEYPLQTVLVIAPGGREAFTADRLAPGVERPLAPVSPKAGTSAWIGALKGSGAGLTGAMLTLMGRDGAFYATLAEPGALLRPTLAAIRWRDDVALLTGPAEFAPDAGK